MSSCCHKHSLSLSHRRAPFTLTARIFCFFATFWCLTRKSCQKLFTFIRQMSITRAPPARTRISILHFRRHLLSLAHRSQLAANGPQKWTSKWKRKTFSRSFFCHSNIIFGFGIHRWCFMPRWTPKRVYKISCTLFRIRAEKSTVLWLGFLVPSSSLH